MILDTSATKHMANLLDLFITLIKVKNCYVTLCNGTTKINVMGKSLIRVYMDSHVVELQHIFFVPNLEDTLFSVTEHIQSSNCSLKTEKNSYTLYYPTFSINAKLDNEVQVNITSYSDLKIQPDFTTDQTTMVNQHHKILRTINKEVSTVQSSVTITLIIMHILSIIY